MQVTVRCFQSGVTRGHDSLLLLTDSTWSTHSHAIDPSLLIRIWNEAHADRRASTLLTLCAHTSLVPQEIFRRSAQHFLLFIFQKQNRSQTSKVLFTRDVVWIIYEESPEGLQRSHWGPPPSVMAWVSMRLASNTTPQQRSLSSVEAPVIIQ